MSRKLNWNNNKILRLMCFVIVSAAVGSANAGAMEKTQFQNAKPIPDSKTASASGNGIAKAKLSCATDRYAHGVLGDAIEAGCLVLLDDNDESFTLDLPQSQVFEDLEPRIADINGDGINDVVVIRSDSSGGAAIAIYTIKNNNVEELAATPPIGLSNRWLAPVGIADFNNDGNLDIAYVQTPHIGGILKVWSMIDKEFKQIAERRGFSNHSIGSTRVSTAKLVDINKDGVMDMALPDQSRRQTIWVTLVPELSVLDTKPYQPSYFD